MDKITKQKFIEMLEKQNDKDIDKVRETKGFRKIMTKLADS
jgi:hypothetical protein